MQTIVRLSECSVIYAQCYIQVIYVIMLSVMALFEANKGASLSNYFSKSFKKFLPAVP
jgi:hypothetical protein